MRSTASRWPPFQSRASNRSGARRVISRNSALYSAKAPAIRRAASRPLSVKVCRQLRVQLMLVQPLDLRREDSSGGELREPLHGKELHGVGLAAHGRGPADALAEEEQLVDVVNAGRMRVTALVDQRGELHRPGVVTRFLEDLAHHGAGGRVVDVDPAAGEGPLAVGALAHEQHAIALENSATDVDLRGGVAFLALPESFRLRDRDVELRGEDGGDQLRELRVALTVEGVV